jgi:hypothetical protein
MTNFPISPPLSNQFQLVVAPKAAWQDMLSLAAKLALQGPLRIFDGGNRTNVYFIAKHIRRCSPRVDECLEHIRLARAFTCYQMLHLLSNAPADQQPLLVLDLLASFYDENVSQQEAQRLLNRVLREIERFRGKAPLVISVRSTAPDLERNVLLEQLAAKADHVITLKLAELSQPPAPEPQLTFPF